MSFYLPYPPPGLPSPRDRYLVALAEVKAAEEELAHMCRQEEIQQRKRIRILCGPYLALAPSFSELVSLYGQNLLVAYVYPRDYVHTAAFAERHALKAALGRCPSHEFVSLHSPLIISNPTTDKIQSVVDSRPSYLSITTPTARTTFRSSPPRLRDFVPHRIPQPPAAALWAGQSTGGASVSLTKHPTLPRPWSRPQSREVAYAYEAELERHFVEIFHAHDARGGAALRPIPMRLTPAPAPALPAQKGSSNSNPDVYVNAALDEKTATAASDAEIERLLAELFRVHDSRGSGGGVLRPVHPTPAPAPTTLKETTRAVDGTEGALGKQEGTLQSEELESCGVAGCGDVGLGVDGNGDGDGDGDGDVLEDAPAPSSKEVRFNERVDVISGPFPVDCIAGHNPPSLASTALDDDDDEPVTLDPAISPINESRVIRIEGLAALIDTPPPASTSATEFATLPSAVSSIGHATSISTATPIDASLHNPTPATLVTLPNPESDLDLEAQDVDVTFLLTSLGDDACVVRLPNVTDTDQEEEWLDVGA
ncbi:hypothetical protein DXG01_009093 [Tephrocybe rancida]|nr:hypothetical protein DXG01_009093 [Tephrocybe rancida]